MVDNELNLDRYTDCVLGCGTEYQVMVVDRGGTASLGELDVLDLQWGRKLDDTSTATVSADATCCTDLLSGLRTWRHELLIIRDGEEVWTGPIVELTYERDSVQIEARDVTAYLARRSLPGTIDYTQATGLGPADLSTIARTVVVEAFSLLDPGVLPYLQVRPTGVSGERKYGADDADYALDKVNELAKTGMDYTVLGRRIILAGETSLTTLPLLTGEDFIGKLRVVEDGYSGATMATVIGKGVIGRYGGVDDFFGLVEIRLKQETILDQASADAAARAIVLAGNPVPLVIDSTSASQLSPEAPICINELVPGAGIPILLDASMVCRPVATTLRIKDVTVKASSSGTEQVSLGLVPLGSITKAA